MSSSSSSSLSSGGSDSDEQFGLPVATQPLPTPQLQGLRIRDHVLVVLDYEKENYGLWRRQFLAALAKFGLTDHVDGSPAQGSSDWVLNDFAVVSWYNATVTPSTLEIIEDRKNTAYTLWRSIRSLFRSNRDTRATYLLDDFHSFSQGDLSIVEYTSKMKQMADTLRDLGCRVKTRELIHNVLRGLDERLQHAVPHMTSGRLPSFVKLRTFLLLEEQRLARQARVSARNALIAQAQALHAAHPPPPPSAPTPSFNFATLGSGSSATSAYAGSSGHGGKKKKKTNSSPGGGASYGRGSQPANNTRGARAPAPRATTVAGTFHGLLGASPAGSAPAQPHALQATSSSGAAATPHWDQSALIAALSQMSLPASPASSHEWIVDRGASSHMGSGSGSGHQDSASPM